MGTTLISALLHGKYATVAHVGDSRAYLLRSGGITQVTRDHTPVAEDVAQGRMSADAAKGDPRRNQLILHNESSPNNADLRWLQERATSRKDGGVTVAN